MIIIFHCRFLLEFRLTTPPLQSRCLSFRSILWFYFWVATTIHCRNKTPFPGLSCQYKRPILISSSLFFFFFFKHQHHQYQRDQLFYYETHIFVDGEVLFYIFMFENIQPLVEELFILIYSVIFPRRLYSCFIPNKYHFFNHFHV